MDRSYSGSRIGSTGITLHNRGLLRLAVERLLPALTVGEHEIRLVRLPKAPLAKLRVTSLDGAVYVSVDALDGSALEAPLVLAFDGIAPPDEGVIGAECSCWLPVVGSGLRPEPRTVDATGRDVLAQVDTAVYKWQLVCACGRVRYAKRNALHQVSSCRVCTAKVRRARRTEQQRAARR